jgi:putative membrane protein
MRRFGLLSLVFATALTVGCNQNPSNDTSKDTSANPAGGSAVGTAGTNNVTAGDRDFVRDVAIANMAEIDLATLALQQSTNADVKKFAQMMIDDHTKAGDQLKSIASQNNIEVPAQVDDQHQDIHNTLAEKKGVDFDAEYANKMADGHQDFVDKLESRIDKKTVDEWKSKTSGSADDATKPEVQGNASTVLPEKSDNPITAAINQWAADTYPTAQAHLTAAKALDKNIKRRTTD